MEGGKIKTILFLFLWSLWVSILLEEKVSGGGMRKSWSSSVGCKHSLNQLMFLIPQRAPQQPGAVPTAGY